jgi:hypothetical protein
LLRSALLAVIKGWTVAQEDLDRVTLSARRALVAVIALGYGLAGYARALVAVISTQPELGGADAALRFFFGGYLYRDGNRREPSLS